MTIAMTGKEYNGLIKYLKAGLSKDPTRGALQNIHVFSDGDRVTFETCNAYLIKRQRFTVTDGDLLDFDATIDVPPVKVLAKDVIGIEFLTTGLNLSVNGTTYFVRYTGLKYVNTGDFFNKSEEDVIEYGFNADYLRKVLDGYTGQIKMTLRTDNSRLGVFIEDLEDPEKECLLLPVIL